MKREVDSNYAKLSASAGPGLAPSAVESPKDEKSPSLREDASFAISDLVLSSTASAALYQDDDFLSANAPEQLAFKRGFACHYSAAHLLQP
jgi:hypothetical protein